MRRFVQALLLAHTAALVMGGASPVAAQAATTTTTTTTTSTTTTTLLPHPYSDATAACIRQAKADRRTCRSGGGSGCAAAFDATFPKCFASGTGVKCATKCVTTRESCFTKLPTTKKNCRKTCATAKKADVAACHVIARGDTLWAPGDASCFSTAQATFDLCRSVCAGLAADCDTAFTFCVANCPNL